MTPSLADLVWDKRREARAIRRDMAGISPKHPLWATLRTKAETLEHEADLLDGHRTRHIAIV